jgi:hypothetical protein
MLEVITRNRDTGQNKIPNMSLVFMDFILVHTFFSFLWGIFALLDPDSESGSGSSDLIESGSSPNPKRCCFMVIQEWGGIMAVFIFLYIY